MPKIRVGVIGSGHIGKFHARVYRELPDVELVYIADTNPERQKIAKKLKVLFTNDYRNLLGKVDAVSIAVPTPFHYTVARDFLNTGTHVLIEKPITVKLEEADQLLSLAQEKQLVLQTGHIERFNNAWVEVNRILKQPLFIEVHRLGPFLPRAASAGVVLDLMIHDIDIILNLVRSPIKQTDAVGIRVLTEFEDLANARIKFENNCVVNLTASRLTPEPQRKIRIFQPDAYISIDFGWQKVKIFTKKGNRVAHRNIRVEKTTEPLKRELMDFLNNIRKQPQDRQLDWASRDALKVALEITDQIRLNFEELLAMPTSS